MSEKEKLTFSYYGNSDIGLIRIENQDSFGKFPQDDFNLYSEKGQLFIVADGMGGHVGGREASSLAVDTIQNVYFTNSADLSSSLKEAVEKANINIYKKSESSKQFRGMGTTCTALLLKEDKGFIAHVGDSRIYMIENNLSRKIEQLTEDHTKVHEMVKVGILTEKEAEVYPSKSVLSRALGVEPKVNIDYKNITIKNGQSYILCSDGLAHVTKEEILQIVTANSPEDSCGKLINLANDRGGKDNVTVIVIKIGPDGSSYKNHQDAFPVKKKSFLLPALLVIFFLLVVAAGIKYKSYFTELFKSVKNEKLVSEKDTSQIIDNNTVEKSTDSFSNLQAQADKLFENEKLEDALIIYKKILSNEPMHLGALQGINNIAVAYINKAEKLKNENKLEDALRFYRKALEIQPSNQRLQKLIIDCESLLNK